MIAHGKDIKVFTGNSNPGLAKDICKELAGGSIAADPFWRGPEKNACRFCDYAAACHFEPGRGGDCKRWLARVSVKEFWEQIEEEH